MSNGSSKTWKVWATVATVIMAVVIVLGFASDIWSAITSPISSVQKDVRRIEDKVDEIQATLERSWSIRQHARWSRALDKANPAIEVPDVYEYDTADASADNMLTTSDVAQMEGTDQETVREWIRAGRIIATKDDGGHYRIPKDYQKQMNRGG